MVVKGGEDGDAGAVGEVVNLVGALLVTTAIKGRILGLAWVLGSLGWAEGTRGGSWGPGGAGEGGGGGGTMVILGERGLARGWGLGSGLGRGLGRGLGWGWGFG
jgi:hypothetical protein